MSQKALDRYRSEGFKSLIITVIKRVLLRRWMFHLLTTSRHYIHNYKYDAPARPYEPIWVNPNEIDQKNPEVSKDLGLGQIRGGDWDHPKNSYSFDRQPAVQAMRQRFVEEQEWEETPMSDASKEYHDHVDRLYSSIKSEGYIPNLGNDRKPKYHKHKDAPYLHDIEPIVCIGKDGQILWRDGIHRITIAKILEIDQIPVNVLCRHHEWQQIRDEFHRTEKSLIQSDHKCLNYFNHPDLRDAI